MKIPKADQAQAAPAKILNYLLSPSHPVGKHKAAFFLRFGFNMIQWEQMANALIRHAAENEVAASKTTPFGVNYTVKGRLQTPDGRNPTICLVWFMEHAEDIPRLVTAYPDEDKAEKDDSGA
jgi:hypothetical protein